MPSKAGAAPPGSNRSRPPLRRACRSECCPPPANSWKPGSAARRGRLCGRARAPGIIRSFRSVALQFDGDCLQHAEEPARRPSSGTKRTRSAMVSQPRSKIATSSPCLLPKCFISWDSLVPASREIATVLVFSYPFRANKRFACHQDAVMRRQGGAWTVRKFCRA